MNQQVRFLLCFCVASVLTSCNAPFRPNPETERQAVLPQYQTVSAILTATVQATFTAAPVAEVRPAKTIVSDVPQTKPNSIPLVQPALTVTQTPAAPTSTALKAIGTPFAKPQNANRVTLPCDIAQPARILDVSVPDDTKFSPGTPFSKTWRLVNAGTCPWTRDYAVVWFSGDDLGVVHAQRLETNVIPGQAVDVTIDLVAPQAPGVYQSNWKLRNAQGALFGIGPASASPFWVRIVVVPAETPTAEVSAPTDTPIPVVFAGGTFTLTFDTMLDLDTGQAANDPTEDLSLQEQAEGQVMFSAANGAKLAPFGIVPPDLPACLAVLVNDVSPAQQQVLPGTYYCYRTSQGLPGLFAVTGISAENKQVDLQFITWAAR